MHPTSDVTPATTNVAAIARRRLRGFVIGLHLPPEWLGLDDCVEQSLDTKTADTVHVDRVFRSSSCAPTLIVAAG